MQPVTFNQDNSEKYIDLRDEGHRRSDGQCARDVQLDVTRRDVKYSVYRL